MIKKVDTIVIASAFGKVLTMASDRLMPPQFEELVNALGGKTSDSTKRYWTDKFVMWAEIEMEDGNISDDEFNDIVEKLM